MKAPVFAAVNFLEELEPPIPPTIGLMNCLVFFSSLKFVIVLFCYRSFSDCFGEIGFVSMNFKGLICEIEVFTSLVGDFCLWGDSTI